MDLRRLHPTGASSIRKGVNVTPSPKGSSFIHRIGTRLGASFVVLVLVMASLATFGIRTLSTMDVQQRKSQKLSSGAFAALRLGDAKRQQRVYQAEYAVDQDPDDLKEYNVEQTRAKEQRDLVLADVSDPKVRALVGKVDEVDAQQRQLRPARSSPRSTAVTRTAPSPSSRRSKS